MNENYLASDCGCWTDANGYWQLSEKCRKEELEIWRRTAALASDPKWLDHIRNSPQLSAHDRAVAYFRQELRNDDHPER